MTHLGRGGCVRRALAFAGVLLACSALSGCLWICRVPMPCHERYSDEGECTNRVWRSMVTECRLRHGTNAWWCAGTYPTVRMRCVVTRHLYQPIPEGVVGERLHRARMAKAFGWLPLALLWLTTPVDAVVDTLLVPYDVWGFEDRAGTPADEYEW